jgi:hypothetical protein
MDHVVYLDTKAQELEKLETGEKTMIVRGATGRKLPYGRVDIHDRLYFIQNNREGLVRAYAVVSGVLNSEKLSEEQSRKILETNQDKLCLTSVQFSRWAGKRYLVLIEVQDFCPVEPFAINRAGYSNMDDWLPVGVIESVKE